MTTIDLRHIGNFRTVRHLGVAAPVSLNKTSPFSLLSFQCGVVFSLSGCPHKGHERGPCHVVPSSATPVAMRHGSSTLSMGWTKLYGYVRKLDVRRGWGELNERERGFEHVHWEEGVEDRCRGRDDYQQEIRVLSQHVPYIDCYNQIQKESSLRHTNGHHTRYAVGIAGSLSDASAARLQWADDFR